MESETPAQLPVSQPTQAQPPPVLASTGQPITYQMQPGQAQPVFVQLPAGQPATTPEGQPIQYYYAPTGQPVPQHKPGAPAQPVQSAGQPVFIQGTPGQPVQPGQPVYIQSAPGYPVQPGQQVYVQSAGGQPVQQQQHPGAGFDLSFDLNIDIDFLKSPRFYIKIAEFVTLLGAWASLLKYVDMFNDPNVDGKANFFKGITIFSWVVVILYLIIHIFSLPKICKCNRPSIFTITSVVFFFFLFALLLACTGNLVPRAVLWSEYYGSPARSSLNINGNLIALYIALAFGFLSCILFVVDMAFNYREFQSQRAKEPSPDQGGQGPPQRRVWDINYEYLRSPLFKMKCLEMALLFGAWVCILKYLDIAQLSESKANVFKGMTIFAWVMVILLALTVIFSFDKIASRSSPWTLMVFLVHVVLSIFLSAGCGNLIPLAVDWGQIISYNGYHLPSNVIALYVGLGFGWISWIIFIVDMIFIYRQYREQRAHEFPPQQISGQPFVQQPVVIMPQAYQPVAHPGQQPSQYPGQPAAITGVPAPAYTSQPQQEPSKI